MKFGDLELHAFMAIEAARITLTDRGLVAIQGVNQDGGGSTSNGAGKSSIADGLSWVAFGKTARGVTGDDVVNETMGKGTIGSFNVLDDDGSNYAIQRARKHPIEKNGLRVWCGATEITKGTTDETQKLIETILGCSYEVFCAAIYAGQEQLPDLPSKTDKELKLLVEQAAGIDQIQEAYAIAVRRLSNMADAMGDLHRDLDRAHEKRDDFRQRIGDFNLLNVDFEDKRLGGIVAVKASITMVEHHHDHVKKAFNPLLYADLRNELAAAHTKMSSFKSEQAESDRLFKVYQTMDSKAQALLNSCKMSIQNKKVEQRKYDTFDDRIGTPCNECGKPYDAHDIEPAKLLAKKRVEKMDVDLKAEVERLHAVNEKTKAAKKLYDDHHATLTDLTELSRRVTDLNGQIGALDLVLEEIDNYEDSIAHHERKLADLRDEKSPYEPLIEKETADLAVVEACIVVIEEKIRALDEKLNVAKAVVDIYGPAGVRAHILDTVTPYLNARTAHYLAILSDGVISANWLTLTRTAKGELRERFKIEITYSGNPRKFQSISGGEKRKVRLACALALQDLVASRAAKPIDLFIGDEIDDALDDAGLERLMTVLEEKARERGTVMVISHNSLRDWIRETVTVTRKDGLSRIDA